MTIRGIRAASLALGALLVLSGCGRIETVLAFGATAQGVDRSVVLQAPAQAAKASCAGKLTNDNRLTPPAGMPTPPDTAWLLGRGVPGKAVYLGWVVALEPRLAQLRTELVDEAKGRGYTVTAGEWDHRVLHVTYGGPVDVEVTVQPYCRDRLALRYVVGHLAETVPTLPLPAVAAARACPNLKDDAAGLTGDQLPLAYPAGATTLRIGAANNSDVYTALVPGSPSSVGAVRDGLLSGLSANAFITAPLPVEGGLAKTLLAGPRTGNVVVQPWCKGVLALRYELVPAQDVESPAASAVRPCTGRDGVEALPEPLPDSLKHVGQTVLLERRGTTYRTWTALGGVADAVVGDFAGRIGNNLKAQGGTLLPLTAPEGVRAATVRLGSSWVLVVIRPFCLDHVAEQYVVTP